MHVQPASHLIKRSTQQYTWTMPTITFPGEPILLWIVAAAATVLVWRAAVLVRDFVSSRIARFRPNGRAIGEGAAAVVKGTSSLLLLLGAALLATILIDFPSAPRLAAVRDKILILLVLMQIGIWTARLVQVIFTALLDGEGRDPSRKTALGLILFVGQMGVWLAVLLLALENLGVDITALIAGLGIGGIAVALALQNVLGDLFASLSIVLDKPFEVGDFIVAGELSGTVERIGVKTTRVRSISGEQIVFSNSDLLSTRVRNFKRMYERRVIFTVDVIYETALEKLKEVPAILREAIESQDLVRFDRAHLKEAGSSSYVFEAVYFVVSPEFNAYMDRHQQMLWFIIERFAERGIEFAYPTQTLYVVAPSRMQVSSTPGDANEKNASQEHQRAE